MDEEKKKDDLVEDVEEIQDTQDTETLPEEEHRSSLEEEDTPRRRLKAKLKPAYPDDDLDDDEIFYQRLEQFSTDRDKELDEMHEYEKTFGEMFSKNPKAAEFMVSLRDGGNLVRTLIRVFGEDILMAATDPDKAKEFADAQDEYLDNLAKDKAKDKEREANWIETFTRLAELQEKEGWDDDTADEVLKRIIQIADDALNGIISEETFKGMMRAMNYDKDISVAREEGEVSGRNANIEEKLRKRKEGDGVPHLNGGAGNAPQAKRKKSIFDFASEA